MASLSIDEVIGKLSELSNEHDPDHFGIETPEGTILLPTSVEYDNESSTIWIRTEDF